MTNDWEPTMRLRYKTHSHAHGCTPILQQQWRRPKINGEGSWDCFEYEWRDIPCEEG